MKRRKFSNKVKLLLKINVVLFSILAIIVALNTSVYLDRKNVHEENFVNIRITKTYSPTDTSDPETLLDNIEIYEGTASGLAIKTIDSETYIITAAHFCVAFSSGPKDLESDTRITITDTDSKMHEGDIIFISEEPDLCLIESSSLKKVETIQFSVMPAVGDKVYAISSPLEISQDGVLLHFEGFFSGCDENNICFYTIPATNGSSGSVVFNQRGRAIGMIQMVPSRFNSVSMGSGYHLIDSFLKEASLYLNIDLY